MPLTTTGASLRRLPLFFAHCPDRAGALARRLQVRPAHLERWKVDCEQGYGEFGCGYLPLDSPSSSSSSSSPSSEAAKGPATPVIDGSVMLIRAESLDKAWERIKSDVYWKEGVWDTEKCFVRQFIKNPTYDDLS